MSQRTVITIQTSIHAPIEKVWEFYTSPEHIINWNHASDDWHSPHAENNLQPGGKFSYRMEARDGSAGFDFSGTYTRVEPFRQIDYLLDDNREVRTSFTSKEDMVTVISSFETEDLNSAEMQRTGWQAILDNFRKYSENMLKQ